MKWLKRLFLAALLLGLAAAGGWRYAKVRAYPMGAGEWLDSPRGGAYAALYQIHERPFFGRSRTEWRVEAGLGTAVRPERIVFRQKVRARDLPDPLSAETAMRWEDDAVVFTLKTNNLRVAVFPSAR